MDYTGDGQESIYINLNTFYSDIYGWMQCSCRNFRKGVSDSRRIFDQIEADLRLSATEYISTKEVTIEQERAVNNILANASRDFNNARAEMKSKIKDMEEYLGEIGYKGSIADFIEMTLKEMRETLEQQLEDLTEGEFILKHAKIDRGFWGSIWHFIRNHWVITLIILGVIGLIYETLENLINRKIEKGEER